MGSAAVKVIDGGVTPGGAQRCSTCSAARDRTPQGPLSPPPSQREREGRGEIEEERERLEDLNKEAGTAGSERNLSGEVGQAAAVCSAIKQSAVPLSG